MIIGISVECRDLLPRKLKLIVMWVPEVALLAPECLWLMMCTKVLVM